jgi:hypothetical protein
MAGELQAVKVPWSSEHSNAAPGGWDTNSIRAVFEFVDSSGCAVISVCGTRAGVKIDHVQRSGVGSTRVPETARTWKVWLRFASPRYVTGDAHSLKDAPSREHSKVAPDGVDSKENVAVESCVRSAGLLMICVCGVA